MRDGFFRGTWRKETYGGGVRKGNEEWNQNDDKIETAYAEGGGVWLARWAREQERKVQEILPESLMWALKLEKEVHETLNLPESKQKQDSPKDAKANTSLYKQVQEVLVLRCWLIIFESPLTVK